MEDLGQKKINGTFLLNILKAIFVGEYRIYLNIQKKKKVEYVSSIQIASYLS